MKIGFRQLVLAGFMILLLSFILSPASAGQAQSAQVWSDPINLSHAGSSSKPLLVVDATGVIHAAWVDEFDGYKYTKSEDGMTWTSPITIRFPFSPKDFTEDTLPPIFVAADNGEIYAFWQGKKQALYYSLVSSGLNLPVKWPGGTKLADSVVDFSVKMDPQGIVHVGYISSLGTDSHPAGVYYLRLSKAFHSEPINLYASQYFRALAPENANVHLAISQVNEQQNVYVVWDDRHQKRIFLSKSTDRGRHWGSAVRIRGADGSVTPYNIDVGAVENKVLLLWQSGVPGGQCAQFSQWSVDGGELFAPPVKMLNEQSGCPQATEFILMNENFSVVLLNIFDDISLVAWNGLTWSKPETQNEIITFTNPETFESVIFGCQKPLNNHGQLFMIGCDKGDSRDVWISSRPLGSVRDWFPPSSLWNIPVEVASVDQQMSALSAVSDSRNRIHMFWVQTPLPEEKESAPTIQYIGWNGEEWSSSATIISGLDGQPIQLKAKADRQERLLLAWVNGKTGDVFFSSAESVHANIASQWERPHYIPSVSQANSSPDILVDDSGKILVVYAIAINEQRGIYFVESHDGGRSWTQPFRIFDAASAGWDIVDQPNITLTGDGRLHVLFRRYSFQGEPNQSLGLYYSQSSDGGSTWSDPAVVSDQPVVWSGVLAHDKSTVHRLWQESRQATLVSFHQISQDGGVTWSRPIIVSNMSTPANLVTQTVDRAGNLYLVQLTSIGTPVISSHMWNGASWISQDQKELYIKDRGAPYSLTATISSEGNLLVSVLAEYPNLSSEFKSSIISIGKSVALQKEIPVHYPAIIAAAQPTVVVTEAQSDVLPASTQISPFVSISEPRSFLSKNLVGFLLLGAVLILTAILFRPVSRKHNRTRKTSQ